jgi:ABC-type tungstate transport system permease subunit
MPTPTYTPLATVTLTSSASSVTFSNIPATYRDLILVSTITSSINTDILIRFNSDLNESNYPVVFMRGTGSAADSGTNNARIGFAFTGTSIQVNTQIMDYSATDKHKTFISRADASGTGAEAFANRWASTSAITSVQVLTSTGNWASGATFNLFGIEA